MMHMGQELDVMSVAASDWLFEATPASLVFQALTLKAMLARINLDLPQQL